MLTTTLCLSHTAQVELKKKYLDDLAARSAGKGKGQGQACLKGM